jgi:hypothetical protein
LNNEEMKTDSPVWFVGASYSGNDDQMPRFLEDGFGKMVYAPLKRSKNG